MHFSDDDIIAYLLGDADNQLVSRIRSQLAEDPELLDRISQMRSMLGHLDSIGGMYEPPGDLVDSTLNRIDESEQVQLSHSDPTEGLAKTRSAGYQGRADSLALTLCLGLIACMVLPAIIKVRFAARKNQCAQNLIHHGQSIAGYSLNDSNGHIPFVGNDQRTGFAGVYTVHLVDSGYGVEISHVTCPSFNGAEHEIPRDLALTIPDLDELNIIEMPRLVELQKYLGGNYAYNVGVQVDGVRVAPISAGRSHFAILADAPNFTPDGEQFFAHEGQGINILYEDGHVEFVSLKDNLPTGMPDHPFRNFDGIHAAGLTHSDAVLAPSGFSPSSIEQWK